MRVVDPLQPYARRAFVRAKLPLLRVLGPRHQVTDKRVTFLSGFARSGTNMVMEVFEWSPKTEVFREGGARSNTNFRLLDDDVVLDQVLSSPSQFVLVKALQENHRLTRLMASVPHARSAGERKAPDIALEVRETCDGLLAQLDAVWDAQGI